MKKISIDIIMDKDFNIKVSNKDNTDFPCFHIAFDNKQINAEDVFKILDYSTDSAYNINDNISEIDDEQAVNYFDEIIKLFKAIIKEVNELNVNIDEHNDDDLNNDEHQE